MTVSHLINQKPYERVVHVLRRDAITFIPTLLLFAILLIIPLAIYTMIDGLFPLFFMQDTRYALGILAISLYYLSILLFFFHQFIIFYLDMWVVTNDRIIDVEQLGLFSRTISEIDLFRIQDVTADVHGVFATLFRYGTVTVKTASNNSNIIFFDIPKPNEIREELIHLSHEDRKYHYGTVQASED
ncbi:MAG: PH domain-containing protein [Candidatus Magasanikbacteria bacterium]|jgi:membrane protein YdbS with pleckstrin-like domain|nr:PH domain-containing protein [Candidatus Magasanikbacteria bacterium]